MTRSCDARRVSLWVASMLAASLVTACGPRAAHLAATANAGGETLREPARPQVPAEAFLELRPNQASVAAGGKVVLELLNTGNAPLRFDHAGASSSCGAFRFTVRLVGADGKVYSPTYEGPDRACLGGMVPAQTFVFSPGEVAEKFTIDTSAGFYELGGNTKPREAKSLPAGAYTVIARGAGEQARATLRIR